MSTNKISFFDFEAQSFEEWKATLKKEVGDKFNNYSFSIQQQGITTSPYYHAETSQKHEYPITAYRYPKVKTELTISSSLEGNKKIINVLDWGVEALGIQFHQTLTKIDFKVLFKDVNLDILQLHFALHPHQYLWVNDFIAYLNLSNHKNEKLKGSFIFLDDAGKIISIEEQLALIKPYYLDLPTFHWITSTLKSTENTVDDLLHLFKNLNSFLYSVAAQKKICASIQVSTTIGSLFFFEIGRLKAIQILWSKLLQKYQLDFFPLEVHIKNSDSGVTDTNPHQNLIQHSTEALSAILGGCSSISLAAHFGTDELSEDFYKRITVNIQHLLQHEARLDKVADPTKGSYFIEDIVQKIAFEVLEKIA